MGLCIHCANAVDPDSKVLCAAHLAKSRKTYASVRKPRKVTPLCQAVLDAFAAHPEMHVQQIADLVGCAHQTVSHIRAAHGIQTKSRVRRAYPRVKEAYMVSLIRKHMDKSVIVIANLLGCSDRTVYNLCKKHGINREGKGGRPKGCHSPWAKSRRTTLIGQL